MRGVWRLFNSTYSDRFSHLRQLDRSQLPDDEGRRGPWTSHRRVKGLHPQKTTAAKNKSHTEQRPNTRRYKEICKRFTERRVTPSRFISSYTYRRARRMYQTHTNSIKHFESLEYCCATINTNSYYSQSMYSSKYVGYVPSNITIRPACIIL